MAPKKLPKTTPRLPPGGDSLAHAAAVEAFAAGKPPPASPVALAPPPGQLSLTAELLDAPAAPVTVGAFYRLWPAQVEWLAEVARQRKATRGGRGRVDASEVLRLVLDKAIAEWQANGKAS